MTPSIRSSETPRFAPRGLAGWHSFPAVPFPNEGETSCVPRWSSRGAVWSDCWRPRPAPTRQRTSSRSATGRAAGRPPCVGAAADPATGARLVSSHGGRRRTASDATGRGSADPWRDGHDERVQRDHAPPGSGRRRTQPWHGVEPVTAAARPMPPGRRTMPPGGRNVGSGRVRGWSPRGLLPATLDGDDGDTLRGVVSGHLLSWVPPVGGARRQRAGSGRAFGPVAGVVVVALGSSGVRNPCRTGVSP